MKKLLKAIASLIYGVISVIWAFCAVVFITHPDSSPGTRDWEENKIFIPIGFVMLILWLLLTVFIAVKLRRSDDKSAFPMCALFTAAGAAAVVITMIF